jgi:cation diffusion facilitator family transporter
MDEKNKNNNSYMEDEIQNRGEVIVKTSIVGIVANLFLVTFKAIVGVLSNSIAVILDALNNLSDAVSSIVTIVGSKLSEKKPTKKHPMGYGRIEYMSAMIVSFIVLYAGITAAISSVRNIFEPKEPTYTVISLVIIGVAVLVKVFLGRFVIKRGKNVNSQALVASGYDALFDSILSLSVFLSALIFMIFHISLEAYVGLVISIFIVKAGIEMMLDTINDILGQRADAELTKKIKHLACEVPEVMGAYDLLVTNYGPDKNYASMHVELPDNLTVEQADVITRKVQHEVYANTGVILTGVGIYSHNTKNDEAAEIRNNVRKIVLDNEWALQMHGFYVDIPERKMRFDVVFSFDIDLQEGQNIVRDQILKVYPGYDIIVTADVDISD